ALSRRRRRSITPSRSPPCVRATPPSPTTRRSTRFWIGRESAPGSRPERDASVRRGGAPDVGEPLIAPAGVAVEPVPDPILLGVVLVVLLGRPELSGRNDLGHDRPGHLERLRDRLLRRLGEPLLCVVVVEDGGAVLIAVVAELSPRVGRVDVVPEDV